MNATTILTVTSAVLLFVCLVARYRLVNRARTADAKQATAGQRRLLSLGIGAFGIVLVASLLLSVPSIRELVPSDLTLRTRRAVASWCGKPVAEVTLDLPLDTLNPGGYMDLRAFVNDEFKKEKNFPIDPDEWRSLKARLKTVRNLRTEISRRSSWVP